MTDRSSLRLFVLRVLVVSILATLFGRLWFLQVHAGDTYVQAATSNRIREVVVPAPRGRIYDAQGRLLVGNRTALVVSVNRSLLLREPDDGKAVLERLSPIVGLKPAEISRLITPCSREVKQPCWNGSPYQPVPIKEYDVSKPDQARRVLMIEERREEFPAVTAQLQAVRDYEHGKMAAHVLGYLGPISEEERDEPQYEGYLSNALIGRTGVEATYDRALHGVDGVQRLVVDKDGGVVGTDSESKPVAGDHLVLSIDAKVQKVAEKALADAVAAARTRKDRGGNGKYKADSGAVVVMEAKTGRVVAMASYPSYDPSLFVGGISAKEYADLVDEKKGAPLINRPIQGLFAPASTFKVITTAGAVESGHYPLRGHYPCPGGYAPLGGKRNFEGRALGTIDLHTALVKSCDTIYYKFAYEQWLRDGGNRPKPNPGDHMFKMAEAFGLGKRTGIDLPSEKGGQIENRAFKKEYWEATKSYNCKAAKTETDAYLKAIAQDNCVDGFRMRGGDAANFSIGQGMTVVTPLQLATVYAAFANGGRLVQPTVGRALVSADGRRVTPVVGKDRGRIPVRDEVIRYINNALAGVTQQGGTAYGSFAGLPISVAGKTGTAEVGRKQDTAWFASFAPVQDPELVVVGMVAQGGTGGTTAAPLVADVYKGIYGLQGRPAALPGGKLPELLPRVRPDGTVAGPTAKVPGPTPSLGPALPAGSRPSAPPARPGATATATRRSG